MRFLLIIATILLFAHYGNIGKLFYDISGDPVIIILHLDTETEDEKKTEKDPKKIGKHHYYFDHSNMLSFCARHKKNLHQTSLCLKGHCPLIDQPPEV